MKIALIGYGKMGKTIEELAMQNDHEIELIIDENTMEDFTDENLRKVDVAIEFSTPDAAFDNIVKCINSGVPVVSGTTGWLHRFDDVVELCRTENGAFFYSSNFSLGVNIFFKLNQYLAKIMNKFPDFKVSVEETHHIHKIDAPSGTAITIAEDIIKNSCTKDGWLRDGSSDDTKIAIKSHRIGEIPGIHLVRYDSPIENIDIIHSSKSRVGLAMGAITAANFIIGKTGVFGMDDLLELT